MSLLNNGYVNAPIWSQINISPRFHPFADAVYSMIIGERKAANITQKARSRKDWINRSAFDMMDTEIDIELYENDLQTFYNWLLLAIDGPCNAQFIGPDQKFWNYVENVGNNIGTPVGSWLLGCLPSYEVGDVERSIKLKLQGGGYRREWRLINQSGNIAYPGGISGADITGFVHRGYDITRVGAPGVVSITNSAGDNLPFLTTATKVTLEPHATPSPSSPRHQPILNGLNIKIESEIQTSDLAETQDALESYVNEDQNWTFDLAPNEDDIANSRGNMKIVCHNSVFPIPENDMKETGAFTTKIGFEGFVPIDQPGWAGNNIHVDIATNTITLNRVGVA